MAFRDEEAHSCARSSRQPLDLGVSRQSLVAPEHQHRPSQSHHISQCYCCTFYVDVCFDATREEPTRDQPRFHRTSLMRRICNTDRASFVLMRSGL